MQQYVIFTNKLNVLQNIVPKHSFTKMLVGADNIKGYFPSTYHTKYPVSRILILASLLESTSRNNMALL